MVGSQIQRRTATRQSLDDGQIPRGHARVERRRLEQRNEIENLALVARRRDCDRADVIPRIEPLVVDPRRPRPKTRQHVRPLAQPRDVLGDDAQPFSQRRTRRRPIENDQVPNVHPQRRVLADPPHDRVDRTHTF
jgi:hypothetical protein